MTRTLFLLPLAAAVLLSACAKPSPSTTADARFEAISSAFIEEYLKQQPEDATLLGDHRYDDRLNDLSQEGITAALRLRRAFLDSLATIKVEDLIAENRVDYDILRHNLQADIFALDTLRPWKTNPTIYNPGNAIFSLVARDFAPLSVRMKAVAGRLAAIPKYIEAARRNLENPSPLHTETAIRQNEGTIALLTQTLTPFIDSLVEDERDDIIPLRDDAVLALKEYGSWLRTDLAPRSKGDFRLGADLYRRKLAYALDTDMTPEHILARAEQDLERTTSDMAKTAEQLRPSLLPGKSFNTATAQGRTELIRAVLARLAETHPTNETIVAEATKAMREATEFVRSHDIVTVPNDPIDIIVMPEFQRGVAVAYCDSPGPLEKNGKTFFAIAPTPADWSAARAASFYREYNTYMLKNLTVHEAMPGHYLQLMTGNRFKARTLVRGVFPSGVFAEGWATYVEQVMADAGFGGPETKMQQLKMRLRLIINAIIDQKTHMGGMTEKEAMALMMERGFQEEGEAAGKWTRARLTSAQLSTYYVGNIMLNDLRRRFEEHAGDAFDMKVFHDKAISFGTIAPRYLPTLLQLPAASGSSSQAAISMAHRRPVATNAGF